MKGLSVLLIDRFEQVGQGNLAVQELFLTTSGQSFWEFQFEIKYFISLA
jgi:hypothetical protein